MIHFLSPELERLFVGAEVASLLILLLPNLDRVRDIREPCDPDWSLFEFWFDKDFVDIQFFILETGPPKKCGKRGRIVGTQAHI